jgi:hypothetical protein
VIYVVNKRLSLTKVRSRYPDAQIVDVTSTSQEEYVVLSPFFPHYGIPVPYSDGFYSASVEGIWQGLKVFPDSDVDTDCFENSNMRNIKRSVRKHGQPLGHRRGVSGTVLLQYIEARLLLFLPSYLWVLRNKVHEEVDQLRKVNMEGDVVLLDYNTNGDIFNPKTPLSHAALLRTFILDPESLDINLLAAEYQRTNGITDDESVRHKVPTGTTLVGRKRQKRKTDKKAATGTSQTELFV